MAELDTVPASVVIDLVVSFRHPRFWPASRTVLLKAYERGDELAISGMPPAAFRRLLQGFLTRAAGVGAGRLQEALEYLDYPEATADQRACEAYTMQTTGLPIPDERLEHMVAAAPETPGPWLLCTGAYAADEGRWTDHAAAVETLNNAATESLASGGSASSRFLIANARVLEGYGRLRRGDAQAAIPLIEASYADASPPLGRMRLARWWLAQAYLEAGRPADAVTFLRSFWISPVGASFYVLGQTLEELGEDEEAVAAYEDFVAAWEGADPEVQYMVDDARARIGALRR